MNHVSDLIKNLTQVSAWKSLKQKALNDYSHQKINPQCVITQECITLDYSLQRIDKNTQASLSQLAFECQLETKIEALFCGELVNSTEKKPALHTALRAPQNTSLWINNQDIISDVHHARQLMHNISNKIREGKWLGYSNKPVTDVVNIGIGGSHLGPEFCIHAFAEAIIPSLSFHFISDMDPVSFERVTKTLNPETTLFIVSSKSFTTAETLYNFNQAIEWINHSNYNQHFIAVTAHPERANALGLKNTLPIWEWVGGRYSIFSAINLITCIAIGYELFCEFLEGAYEMDKHFRYTPILNNLPVQLALIGIWNNNFLNIHQLLILTYRHQLNYFVPYIQQLDMESNGKSIRVNGETVNYATGPIIWGGSANQAQHSYYQLLCQGTHKIPMDLISTQSESELAVNRLCQAQKEILSQGFSQDLSLRIPGLMPINHIQLKDTSVKSLGALIALYEHKVYCQSIIWDINAFDQPGVESSKYLMRNQNTYV